MNKTEFGKFLAQVITKSPCNKPIRADWVNELMPLLQQTKLYGKKANEPDVKLTCVYRKFGPRKNKFLALIDEKGKELIIGKAKLIEQLYPTKKRKTTCHRDEVLAVMRRTISPQISEFRVKIKSDIKLLSEKGLKDFARNLNRCKLTGRSLNTCKTAVDHIIPFIQLVDEWLTEEKLRFDDIELKGRGSKKVFADLALSERWFNFHAERARLQMVCSQANSKAGSKGYVPVCN